MEVYPEDKHSNAEFYVADSRGFPIWNSDMIVIEPVDGSQEMPWTLGSHIWLSNVKYPSKAKYYFVRKGKLNNYGKLTYFLNTLKN